MSIIELRVLPALAVGRLGASEEPLENFTLELDAHDPIGPRHIKPAETLRVDAASGEIVEAYKPKRIRFRDGAKIRPVAPFLEVFARTSDDTLEPLTTHLLEREGLAASSLTWTVDVANLKIFRRTSEPRDRIEASVQISNHLRHELKGLCANFLPDKFLPLGHVQFIKPTTAFPEIRLRFTPAKGLVYGAKLQRDEPDAFGKPEPQQDPVLSEERVLYDPSKGWVGYDETKVPSPQRTNPGAIYAGYSSASGAQIGWGYFDDECDGIVAVELRTSSRTLTAFGRIGAGPPTFAPDSVPIRTVFDELEQVLLGDKVDPRQVRVEDAEEIVRRAVESVRLMNTKVLNANTVEGRTNAQSTMPRQDSNDFSRFFEPVMTPTSVDNHAVLALHQHVLTALKSGTGGWFAQALRHPEEIGDLTDAGRRKMPAMMRGADGRYLTLSRRQIDTIVNVAVGNMFAKRSAQHDKD